MMMCVQNERQPQKDKKTATREKGMKWDGVLAEGNPW